MGTLEDMGFVVGSSYLYHAAGTRGIELYTNKNSTSVSFLHSENRGGCAEQITVGDFAFLANGSMGIMSYTVSPDQKLVYIDGDDHGVYGKKVWIDAGNVFLSDGAGSVLEYNVDGSGNFTWVAPSSTTVVPEPTPEPEPIPEPIPEPEPEPIPEPIPEPTPEPEPTPVKGRGKGRGKKKLKK